MLVVAMLPPLLPVSMLATPSIVMLLEFGRWPFTVKPLTEPISVFAGVLRQRAGHQRREVEEHPPVVGDVLQRLALERERAFAAHRLQLRSRGLVTVTSSLSAPTSSVSDPVDSLSFAFTTTFVRSERLEALQRGLERIGVGTDDGEHETSAVVGDGGQHVALRAAGHRDRDARQDPALRILDGSRNGCARCLRAKHCRIAREDEGDQGQDPVRPRDL